MDNLDTAYADVVESWRAAHPCTRSELASALEEFKLRFAYNSGRIENELITYHDTREIFENGRVKSYAGDVRTLFEIQNLKECHDLLVDSVAADRELDETFVLEVHRTLTQGTYDEHRWSRGERPGTYKTGDYVVGATDMGSPAFEVADDVRELLGELAAANDENILTVAAYFHLAFEAIHPFADGNGRCGRALMNYLLMRYKHPPIIIFDEDKLAYYGALEAWGTDGDLEPMRTLLKAEAVKTWCPTL